MIVFLKILGEHQKLKAPICRPHVQNEQIGVNQRQDASGQRRVLEVTARKSVVEQMIASLVMLGQLDQTIVSSVWNIWSAVEMTRAAAWY